MTLTETDTEGGRVGGKKRHVKTGENKKRKKRTIKWMKKLFHSHHSNAVKKTAIVVIMVCGVCCE